MRVLLEGIFLTGIRKKDRERERERERGIYIYIEIETEERRGESRKCMADVASSIRLRTRRPRTRVFQVV